MRIYDIRDFGAVADGDNLQTEAIQKAIDACFQDGGGEVQIPKGTFYTGGIRIRSDVTLHLLEGARLMGSRNPEEYFHYINDTLEPLSPEEITDAPYVPHRTILGETAYEENKTEYRYKRLPGSRWNNGLIRAIRAENIAVIGEKDSVIDGCNCYDALGEGGHRGPHGIAFFDCRNITCKGYTLQNTGNWAHHMLFCDNIKVENICVLAGHDGLDVAVCNNITIRNSEFYTGDDCIAGFGNCNVLVQNCVLNSSCSAFRFGGTNVLIEKTKIYGPGKYCYRGDLSQEEKKNGVMASTEKCRNEMLSAFTYYADYSVPIPVQPGNIVMQDCEIENAQRFLHFNYSGNEAWQKHRPLESITFRNVSATGVAMPIMMYGDKDVPVSVCLENVKLSIREGKEDIDLVRAGNFKCLELKNVSVKNYRGEDGIKIWTDGNIVIENTDFDGKEATITKATEPFYSGTV